MALNIKNRVAESLAHELAEATGTTITDAVIGALRRELAGIRRRRVRPELREEIEQLQAFLRDTPDYDTRTAEEIIGYDEYGLPQ